MDKENISAFVAYHKVRVSLYRSFLGFLICGLFACSSDGSLSKSLDLPFKFSDQSKSIKNSKVLTLKMSNSDPNRIGYEVWEQDEDIGVKSIYIHENEILLVDTYHSNLKRIYLKDGSMEAGPSLSQLSGAESGIWLRDLAVFKDKIYVCSDMDSIYVFNMNLVREKAIPVPRGRKYVYDCNPDTLTFFLDSKQREDLSIDYQLLSITDENSYEAIVKTIPIEPYSKIRLQKYTHGRAYEISTDPKEHFIKTEVGKVFIDSSFTPISGYDAMNIDYNSKYLAYFDSDPEKFTLYYYQF